MIIKLRTKEKQKKEEDEANINMINSSRILIIFTITYRVSAQLDYIFDGRSFSSMIFKKKERNFQVTFVSSRQTRQTARLINQKRKTIKCLILVPLL